MIYIGILKYSRFILASSKCYSHIVVVLLSGQVSDNLGRHFQLLKKIHQELKQAHVSGRRKPTRADSSDKRHVSSSYLTQWTQQSQALKSFNNIER